MKLRDIPAIGSLPALLDPVRSFLEAVRESIQVREPQASSVGDPLDKFITRGELVESGFTFLGDRFGGGTGQGPGGVPIVVDGEEPDLTPPPTPTGLAVTAGIDVLFIEHDAPLYTQGHGHDRTVVYGAIRPSGGPNPVFADAVEIAEFQGTVYAYPTEPATTWAIWIKWRSIDGVLSVDPAGGTNGVQATTGEDVAKLLEVLTGSITASQLDAALTGALGSIIDAEDYDNATAYVVDDVVKYLGSLYRCIADTTGNAPPNVTYWELIGEFESLSEAVAGNAAAILAEQTTRADADTAIASSVTALAAQVQADSTFRPLRFYDFQTDAEGWTATGASTLVSGGVLTWTTSASNPMLSRSLVGTERFDGADATLLRARVRRVSGTGTWEGRAYYSTAGHGSSNSFYKDVAAPADPTAWTVLEWDMAALTAGGSDWIDNEITALRIDLVSNSGSVWEFDWIGVGEHNDNPLYAAIQQEATARASADGSLYAQYTVKIDLNGYVSGYGLASEAPINGTPSSVFGVRADRFYIGSPGQSDIIPFIVQATAGTINGVAVPAGVYINGLFVQNGTITNAKIGDLAVTDAKIATLAASKLTAGSIAVGAFIQSTGYVAGSAGWRIHGNGSAEFSNVTIRGATYTGTIFANSGTIGSAEINATDVRSVGFVAGSTGWRLQSGGIFEAYASAGARRFNLSASGTTPLLQIPGLTILGNGTATFSGALSAATGSFAGSLSAATGSFAGSLSAATGSFAGSLVAASGSFAGVLTAAAINAVNTINIAGNAVTVPSGGGIVSPIGLGSNTTIFSFSLNSAGQPIVWSIAVVFEIGAVGGSANATIEILIDGVVEHTKTCFVNGTLFATEFEFSRAGRIPSTSGAVTFLVRGSVTGSTANALPGSAGFALGVKR